MWVHSSPYGLRVGDVLLPRNVTGLASTSYPLDSRRAEELRHLDPTRVCVIAVEQTWLLPSKLLEFDRWIYEVLPLGDTGPDPEPGWNDRGSIVCESALILAVLREPLL